MKNINDKKLGAAFKGYAGRAFSQYIVPFMEKYGYTNIEIYEDERGKESLVFVGEHARPYAVGYPWGNPAPHDDYKKVEDRIKMDYENIFRILGLGLSDMAGYPDYVSIIVKSRFGDRLMKHICPPNKA